MICARFGHGKENRWEVCNTSPRVGACKPWCLYGHTAQRDSRSTFRDGSAQGHFLHPLLRPAARRGREPHRVRRARAVLRAGGGAAPPQRGRPRQAAPPRLPKNSRRTKREHRLIVGARFFYGQGRTRAVCGQFSSRKPRYDRGRTKRGQHPLKGAVLFIAIFDSLFCYLEISFV